MNKQVQEIAADCHQLPERFIRNEDKEYAAGAGVLSPTRRQVVPIIDVSLLNSSPFELEKLKSAVTTWGCFQGINHGIESSFLEKVREIGRLFFGLSAEEKKKFLREEDGFEGYGNDMVFSDDQVLDWADIISLTVLPQHRIRRQFWPQNPAHFREVLDEYSSKIELIYEVVMKALARCLNLEENCFLKQYGTAANISARFNYYPPCLWAEKVLGVKPHGDSSAITILLQDKEVGGLQVLKDDQWVGVPIVHDALTINVGDQIQIMSNGILKSAVHRALVNSKKERMSLAMFCMPQSEKEIGPLDELVTEETPRLYKNVNYDLHLIFKNIHRGTRPIDDLKI